MTNKYPINSDYSNLKTYVINLDDYINNYNKQLPYLLDLGLIVERFSGINALKNEHLKTEYQQYISSYAKNFAPKSVIGCALSHILCCADIKSNYSKKINDPIPFFLIMEDDAFPLYNKEEFYEHLNKSLYEIQLLDSNWDIIQLHSDCIIPTKDTYNTHIACGSAAAYLISINGIHKTLTSKIYSHLDFIQHNFITYNKYRTKENLFYTNEKTSLNRIQVKSKLNYKYYSLLLKSKFCELLNKYTHIIPLRGEKSYSDFFEFKFVREPLFEKEFTVNDLLDYLLTFIILKKMFKRNVLKIE
uniref:Glycosyl transferase family 25 domain-containing protein n=1 Tax=viral metagenome TaxID=1070528 RepID=A0A6C0H444_9ZZZZ